MADHRQDLSSFWESASFGKLAFPLTLFATLVLAIARGAEFEIFNDAALCFFLTILPGALIYALICEERLDQLLSWGLGAAIGLNLLPLSSYLLTIASPHIAWRIAWISIGCWNIIGYVFYRSRRTEFHSPVRPKLSFWMTLLAIGAWLCYLYFYHLRYFYRTPSTYHFDPFFGADVPYLSAIAQSLETSARLTDPSFGGYTFHYHDFPLRWVAALHYLIGGDIYNISWFFCTCFCTGLVCILGYLLGLKFTKSRLAAAAFVVLLLVLPGRSSAIFTEGDSTHFALIQIFAIILLYSRLFRMPNSNGTGILMAILIGLLAKWKFPAIALLPALFAAELWKGRSYEGYRTRRLSIVGGCIIAGIYVIVTMGSDAASSSGIVVGRPLGLLVKIAESVFSRHINLYPAFAISETSWRSIGAFLIALPFFVAWVILRSPRALIAFSRSKNITTASFDIPFLRELTLCVIISTAAIPLSFSPQYFFTTEVYFRYLGLAIASLYFVGVAPSLMKEWRSNVILCTLLVLSFIAEVPLAFAGHLMLGSAARQTLNASLLNSLERAGAATPLSTRIATRRFDLEPSNADSIHRLQGNFEFYAASLKRTVICQGPSDGPLGGMATNTPDSTLAIFPSPTALRWLIQTVADLDTLYMSRDTTRVRTAQRRLNASYLLIDHTIAQSIHEGSKALTDTLFHDSLVTLLRFR